MSESRETAVDVVNSGGSGPAVILCEHASPHIPERYAGLGLAEADRMSHAAWDPGARALSVLLSEALDAPLVAGGVSRLVYDCNRPPEAASAMPEQSETIAVPGNRTLTPEQRAEREETVYKPFCAAVTETVAHRRAQGGPFALITVHSFTPLWFGQPRAVEIGILHDSDSRIADAMLGAAPALAPRAILRNAPYGPADGVTHSLKLHGIGNGVPSVMIEVRNDLLATPADVAAIAEELLAMLRPALAGLSTEEEPDA